MRRSRVGKSLVELLVVIGLIAVLAGIVFSVGHLAWKAVRNLGKGVSVTDPVAVCTRA